MNQEEMQTAKENTIQLLTADYAAWRWMGLAPLDEQEENECIDSALSSMTGEKAAMYAAACQCFFLSRKLHAEVDAEPKAATLVGDYMFSRFAHFMSELDSEELYQMFADFLIKDTRKGAAGSYVFDRNAYCEFIKTAPAKLSHD